MASFTLDGNTYEYVLPVPGNPEATKSWEYGKYPKIMATIPLSAGGSIDVYGYAARWNRELILARWEDDDRRPHTAWIPAGNVRRVTDSLWDIWEYWRCPAKLRGVRWGARLPGMLPS